jgi:GDP-D-mannose dehydratase
MANTALITGVSRRRLSRQALLQRGYRVVGAYRRTSGINVGRLDEFGIANDVELIDMELLEESNVRARSGCSSPTRSTISRRKASSGSPCDLPD